MKITENFTITLTCLFCDAALTKKDNEEFNSNDLIKCQNCGEENDYESVYEIAKQQGIEQVKNEVMEELTKSFKNLKIKI